MWSTETLWLSKNYFKKQLGEIKSAFVPCIYVFLSLYKTWKGLTSIPRLIGLHGIFLPESWKILQIQIPRCILTTNTLSESADFFY